MGWREALHRVVEQAGLYHLRFTQSGRDNNRACYQPAKFVFCDQKKQQLPELAWDRPTNNANAQQLLAGHWPALGFAWQLKNDQDWHCAPDTNRQWPDVFFGAINYRAGNPHGDIRVAWEPSRLQQLPSLALLAQDPEHRQAAVAQFELTLLSWLAANPPYRGIHYVSAMECALRILSVCHAVDMIRPHLISPEKIWPAVIGLVDSHASLIVRRLSLHSSAGNHTLAECVGLIYAGLLFAELPGAKRWYQTGITLLESEAERQFLADGGGVEQAFGYHLLITDLCNLATLLLDSKGCSSTKLSAIVAKAKTFLGSLFSEDWRLPNVGDNDGGYALSPFLRISHQRFNDDGIHLHRESGYSIIKAAEKQRLLVFDHGSLGMAPSYGHGHSDALALFWREQGEDLLVDAGTYTYTGDLLWREYFRGVSAHNTVSVDGLDQAVQQSAFMWSQPFSGRLHEVPASIDGYQVLLASHNGYERVGVRHYRAIILNASGGVLVWDTLISLGQPSALNRTLSLWWQLGGEVTRVANDSFQVQGKTAKAQLCLTLQGGEVALHEGDEQGPSGWYSGTYGKKSPITTLEARYNGNFPHEFYTYIAPGSDNIDTDEMSAFNKIINKIRPLIV